MLHSREKVKLLLRPIVLLVYFSTIVQSMVEKVTVAAFAFSHLHSRLKQFVSARLALASERTPSEVLIKSVGSVCVMFLHALHLSILFDLLGGASKAKFR